MTARTLSEMIEGFWITQLIGTAIDLGIPDVLADEAKSCEQIARSCGADESCVLRVLRALQTVGVCRAATGPAFALTERGQLLRRDVPGSMRGRATFTSGIMWDLFAQLRTVVKSGRALPTGRAGFDRLAADPGLDGMHRAMVESSIQVIEHAVPIHDFERYTRVLDVGGGYGGALSALLHRHPRLLGDVLDLSYLEGGCVAYLTQLGVEGRARFLPGDFFESIPGGYDAYLLKYVIHDWNDADALQILRRCAAAARPDSDVILFERVLPDVLEESPAHQAIMQIDLAMMTAGGKERTASEYRSLLESAGLRMVAVKPTASPCSVIHAVRSPAGSSS